MPVFALTLAMISEWACMTSGMGQVSGTPALLPLKAIDSDGMGVADTDNVLSAQARLRCVRAFTDRETQLLAAYYSVVRPLTAPVMRVVHRVMATDGGTLALAQVMLGGILYPVAVPAEGPRNRDNIEYEFYGGLRNMLSGTLTEPDMVRVNQSLHEYLLVIVRDGEATVPGYLAAIPLTGGVIQRVLDEHLLTRVRSRNDLVKAVNRYIDKWRGELHTHGNIVPKTRTQVPGPGDRDMWVLVAGTGKKSALSKKLANTCQRLGLELARAGFRLVTGGWQGVDEAVAASFAGELDVLQLPVEERLMHVVPSGKVPAFGRGRILTVEQGISEYTECVERARYVVVLGGYGGAERVGNFALGAGCTVLPLADTGGDARLLHYQIYHRDPHERPPLVTQAVLTALREPAPAVATAVGNMMVELDRAH